MVVKDDLGGMAGAYELIDWHDDFGLLWQSANYTGAEEGEQQEQQEQQKQQEQQ